MKRWKAPTTGLYTIGIAGLFLVGFLLLVLFGAQTYRNTVRSQTDNNERRATLSYLNAVAKGCNTLGAVSIEETEFGRTLVIRDIEEAGEAESGRAYAFRIFNYDGGLYEDYGPENRPLSLKSAELVGQTQTFGIRMLKEGLYEVTTDEGRSLLHFVTGGAANE